MWTYFFKNTIFQFLQILLRTDGEKVWKLYTAKSIKKDKEDKEYIQKNSKCDKEVVRKFPMCNIKVKKG